MIHRFLALLLDDTLVVPGSVSWARNCFLDTVRKCKQAAFLRHEVVEKNKKTKEQEPLAGQEFNEKPSCNNKEQLYVHEDGQTESNKNDPTGNCSEIKKKDFTPRTRSYETPGMMKRSFETNNKIKRT